MNKLKTFESVILLIVLVFGILICVVFVFLDTNVAVAIAAPCLTVMGSTLTVVISRHLETKREQEIAHRDKKVKLYDEFLKTLFEFYYADQSLLPSLAKDSKPDVQEIQRNLILWAGPKTIKAYAEWKKIVKSTPVRADHVISTIDLFLALREDLGHSNKGIKRDHMVGFLLLDPDLFLQEYRKNPHVTLDEIQQLLEQKVQGEETL